MEHSPTTFSKAKEIAALGRRFLRKVPLHRLTKDEIETGTKKYHDELMKLIEKEKITLEDYVVKKGQTLQKI